MYCSDDATKPLITPKTEGYHDVVANPTPAGNAEYCSTGHRICGVRTKISNANGMEAVEFVCCK